MVPLFLTTFIWAMLRPIPVNGHICLHSPSPVPGTDMDNCAPTSGQCQGLSLGSDPVAQWSAGSTVTVEWRRPGSGALDQNPQGQARHGGGITEFSLSLDGGQTWKAISRCVLNCPDVGMGYPLKLPGNLPTGRAILSWNWVPALSGAPEFYSNCAVVEITGGSTSGGLDMNDTCDGFQSIPSGVDLRPDGHGNNAGEGVDANRMNEDGCPQGGPYTAEQWNAMFDRALNPGSAPPPAAVETSPAVQEPETADEEAETEEEEPGMEVQSLALPMEAPLSEENGEMGEEALPEATEEPAPIPEEDSTEPSTDNLTEPAINEAPVQPVDEEEDGSCDPSLSLLYCHSGKVNSHYFMCISGKLVQMPLAPGTRCRCRDAPNNQGYCAKA